MRGLVIGLSWGVALLGTVATAFVVGMRTGFPPVRDGIRRLNRAVMNPRQLAGGAGGAGSWASVVRHVGRRSGTVYRTPIGIFATDRGLIVGLPYGSGADWVQNVLAAGHATLEHDGEVLAVDHPELVPAASVNDLLPAGERRLQRLFGIDEVLLLHPATDPAKHRGPAG